MPPHERAMAKAQFTILYGERFAWAISIRTCP